MAAKTAPKAPAAPAAAPETATKAKAAAGGGFNKPLKASKELAAIVGSEPVPRAQVVSKIWEYIKKHNLQNPENKREIVADEKLKKVFGKDKCSMFEMNKLISAHLS